MWRNLQKTILLILALFWQPVLFAAPLQILGMHVSKLSDSVIVCDFTLNKAPLYRAFSLSNPARIVIDFDDAIMSGRINSAALTNTPVKNIRTGKHENNSLRVVFDTTHAIDFHIATTTTKGKDSNQAHLLVTIGDKASSKIKQSKEVKAKTIQPKVAAISKKTVVEPFLASAKKPVVVVPLTVPVVAKPPVPSTIVPTKAIATTPAVSTKSATTDKSKTTVQFIKQAALQQTPAIQNDLKSSVALLDPDNKQKPRDIVVVIDPGHGGKDPGAHGKGGTKEKDVVLAIAKNLQSYLNNQNGYSAILTRDGDYHVNLHERLRIAHVNKADIFLSLHADVYRNSSIKGSTIFALSQSGATSETARWLAEKENISELSGYKDKSGNDLRSILVGLAQNASVKTSVLAGNSILSSLSTVAKLHTSSIEQADFVVLQSPDIPSLLIETGFISDVADEQKLKDPVFQKMFAEALASGIMHYFAQYPPRGTLVNAAANGLHDSKS